MSTEVFAAHAGARLDALEAAAQAQISNANTANAGAGTINAVPIAMSMGNTAFSPLTHSRTVNAQGGNRIAAIGGAAPMDLDAASTALHQVGALKTVRPDAVARAQKDALHNLTLGALENLLARQKSTLADTRLLASLPDGGQLVRQKVAEIEHAIEEKKKHEVELHAMDSLMQGVKLAEQDPVAMDVASPPGGASFAQQLVQGRGQSAVAESCSAEQVNARIAAERARNLESKFRRPPPPVIPPAEAQALIRAQDAEWLATIQPVDPSFSFTAGPSYRDPSDPRANDSDEDADTENAITGFSGRPGIEDDLERDQDGDPIDPLGPDDVDEEEDVCETDEHRSAAAQD